MLQKYFEDAIKECSKDVSPIVISYIKNYKYLSDSESEINISVNGKYASHQLKQRVLPDVKKYLKEKLSKDININVYIYEEESADILVPNNEVNTPIKESIKPKKNNLSVLKKKMRFVNLSLKYRFENYIVGTDNRHNINIARSVADNPGVEYNPLFLYGGVGLGKTHLLQAIGNIMLQNDIDMRVLYIEGRSFRDEFIDAISSKKAMYEFKMRYQNLDALLLDDLQLIEKAQETSRQLFEIFQELYNRGKQIIFVSDRPPSSLNNFDDRLKSRFEQSLILEIEAPKKETRIAIIREKVLEQEFEIDNNVVEYLAENITTDVRKIVGAVMKYKSITKGYGRIFSLEECLSHNVFKNYITNVIAVNASIKDIMKASCRFYDVDEKVLLSSEREKNITKARHIAMFLCVKLSGCSTTEIGRAFNRDHSSVLHAKKKNIF